MIGSILITLALAASVTAMIMYFLNYRGYANALNYGRIAYHIMAVLIIGACVMLWYGILTHQYQYKYIFNYSSTDLPFGLLFATFWGGQEGSFMLWILLTAIVGIILQSYSSKRGDLEPRVMAVFTLATSFLLVMVTPMFKNPFAFIWTDPVFIPLQNIHQVFLTQPFLQSFLFTDNQSGQGFVQMSQDLYAALTAAGISVNDFIIEGRGLNPQLINFWMQIHPPILFIGFSMATVPFAFAIAALMKNDYKDWVKQAFPWVLATAGVLGLGIMLGGYWAYEMLGWGGYWAWDPVENSSLIPWLIGVASIHTLLVQRKSQAKGNVGRFVKTNLVLCLLTYVFVLYSTFLTRSGVLGDASVHSFVDPGMIVYLFLVIFISSFVLLGAGLILYRWKNLTEDVPQDESLLSRELALFTATVVLCASAIIVLAGTSAPLFGSAVDTFFYDEMHLPIAIIIGLLNGASLLIKWKHSSGHELLRKSLPSLALSVVFTAMVVLFGRVSDIMLILLTFSAAFALIINLEIAIKIIRGNMKMLGAYVSHIGIALFILGVVGSAGYSDEIHLDLVRDVPKKAFGYEMTFTGYSPIEDNTKYAFNIHVTQGSRNYNVAPVMYISSFNNSLMREPAILTMWTRDFYISPIGYDPGGQDGHDHGGTVTLMRGGTTEYNNVKLTFDNFDFPEERRDAMMTGGDFEIGVNLIADFNGDKSDIRLVMKSQNGEKVHTSYEMKDANLKVALIALDASGRVDLSLTNLDGTVAHQHEDETSEVLTITASIKPFVNLVWIGTLVLVIGFFVAVARRLTESLVK